VSKDIISDVLNMNPIEIENDTQLPTAYKPSIQTDHEAEQDLKYVRQNLYDIIEKGHGAMDELMSIADQSQHPRSYEVLAQMIKTLVDVNKDLLEIQKKKKDLLKPEEIAGTINNNLFVGSTSDLLKLMNKDDATNN